jgi:hypothetical protein
MTMFCDAPTTMRCAELVDDPYREESPLSPAMWIRLGRNCELVKT